MGGEIEFCYPSRATSKCTKFTAYIPMDGDGIENLEAVTESR